MFWPPLSRLLFFFNDTATTEIYTLSLHDALPISRRSTAVSMTVLTSLGIATTGRPIWSLDRKSTRLNSSHQIISYAVFCLKKKKKIEEPKRSTNYYDDCQTRQSCGI